MTAFVCQAPALVRKYLSKNFNQEQFPPVARARVRPAWSWSMQGPWGGRHPHWSKSGQGRVSTDGVCTGGETAKPHMRQPRLQKFFWKHVGPLAETVCCYGSGHRGGIFCSASAAQRRQAAPGASAQTSVGRHSLPKRRTGLAVGRQSQ